MTLHVSSFYKLFDLPDRLGGAQYLRDLAERYSVTGLVVLSPEGVNATIAGEGDELTSFIGFFEEWFKTGKLQEKRSRSDTPPFRKFVVKLRDEIVTSQFSTAAQVLGTDSDRLSAADWHHVLTSEEEVIVLDVRNSYEIAIGKFHGAIDPGLEQFTEFRRFVQETDLPREQKTLIYCTGGIRCEKAFFELKEAGFKNVYQLDGGILGYLEQFPNARFDGECFVFDDRVALNQELLPTGRYEFCKDCGSPAERTDEGTQKCRFCEIIATDSPAR